MSKANEISINITKALITRVVIDLSDGEKPRYTVEGSLTTDQGRKVSEFTFWNDTWVSKDKQIEIPVNVHISASEIFRALKPIVYKKLNDEWPQLERVTAREDVVDGKESEGENIPF